MGNNFMKIYNEHTRTTEFLEFMESKSFSTYMFLRASIIRDSEFIRYGAGRNTDAYRIYYTYFRHGKLVAHYAMSTMAKYCNKTKGAMSKRIKELEDKGFLKIHKYKTKDGIAYDYEFGYYTGKYGTDDYREYYYLDDYFDKIYAEERIKREEAKFNSQFNKVVDEEVKEAYVDTSKFDLIKIKPDATLRDVINMFDDPNEYVEFIMYSEGRTFGDEELKKHFKNWYAVHNMLSY